jgi:ABC-2 type transport system ATP-binding protein
MSMDASPALRVEKLVKRYGELTAVDGLDLEVGRGECFGLLGPNGAGKTTTVEILEGLNDATAGSVQVLGMSWQGDEIALRQRLGISLQETHLPDKLTVEETLRLFRSFYAQGRPIDEVLGLVELADKRKTWTVKLSGGQKQRLAVGCALVSDPELLFLDEPTTGLDPQSRRQLWDVVLGFKARGRTVLLTTHYMDEAERLCDRVAIVDKGRVIKLGTPRELIASLGGHEIVELATQQPLAPESLASLPGVQSSRREADGVALTVSELHVTLPAVLSMVEPLGLTRLSTHHATLEDVFVHLTGRHLRE